MSKRDTSYSEINTFEKYNLKPIISVKEARKLLGKKVSDQLPDEQIGQLIGDFSAIAKDSLEASLVP